MAEFLYDAFISYRHTEPDKTIAKKLHRALENYSAPRSISGRSDIKKIRRVFRDREELPTSTDLGEDIERALSQSRHLIVVCSPRTPQSRWIEHEIKVFSELHGEDKIHTLLIEGEPEEALPAPLKNMKKFVRDASGSLVENQVDVLAADIRPGILAERPARYEYDGLRKENGRLYQSLLKEAFRLLKDERLRLLAPMFDCSFDDLKRRHQQRLIKQIVAVASCISLFFAMFGLVVMSMNVEINNYAQEAVKQRDIANTNEKKADENAKIAKDNEKLAQDNEKLAKDNERKVLQANGRITQQNTLLSQQKDELQNKNDQLTAEKKRTEEAKQLAELNARLATEQKQAALRKQSQLLAEAALKAVGEGDLAGAVKSGLQAVEVLPAETPEENLQYVEAAKNALFSTLYKKPYTSFGILKGQNGYAEKTVYSPDGRYILTYFSDLTARMWDAASCTELYEIGSLWEYVTQVDFSPDGSMFLLASDINTKINVYDTKTGKIISEIKLPLESTSLGGVYHFLPDSRSLFVAQDKLKLVYDARSGKVVENLKVMSAAGDADTVVSPDGRTYITNGGFGKVWPGYIDSGRTLPELKASISAGEKTAFSPDGRYLAIPDLNRIIIWNTSDWSVYKDIKVLDDPQHQDMAFLSFSPKGDSLYMAYESSGFYKYDVESGIRKATYAKPGDTLYNAGLSPDGRLLFTYTGEIAILDAASGNRMAVLGGGKSSATDIIFSPDNKFVACSYNDGTTRIYTRSFGKGYETVPRYAGEISHQKAWPSSAGKGNQSTVINVTTNHYYYKAIYANPYPLYALSGDQRHIAAGYPDGYLEIWEANKTASGSSKLILGMRNENFSFLRLFFSNDSQKLLTTSYHKVTIYDLKSGKILHSFDSPSITFRYAEFSSDDRLVYALCSDNTLKVWSADTGEELLVLDSGGRQVKDAGFDSGSRNLIMQLDDGSAIKVRMFQDVRALMDFCKAMIGW